MNCRSISRFALGLSATLILFVSANAEISDQVVKIGVLSDMSGVFSDLAGPGSVAAAELAIEDFKTQAKPSFEIKLVTADHQNKTDIGANKAREWFDTEHVDMITDVINSAVALAVSKVATDKGKLLLITGSGANVINNEQCSPNTVLYAWDTYSLANGLVDATMKEGLDSWYFVSVDYVLGKAAEADATAAIKKNGGKILGSVKHPLGATDFSSYILDAHNSNAKVIAFANAGGDLHNSIRAANEYGVNKKHKLVALAGNIADIHTLGVELTQGMSLVESFYWDDSAETREFSKRFFTKMKKMPNPLNAATYSAVRQYLTAVNRINSDRWDTVMADLKNQKFNDVFLQNGYIRADNTMIHDLRMRTVKKPNESKDGWDLYSENALVIKGDAAYKALSESKCPLIKK